MPTVYNPLVHVNCLESSERMIHTIAYVYIRHGCVTLQHAATYTKGCQIIVRVRLGYVDGHLRGVHNFLTFNVAWIGDKNSPTYQYIYFGVDNFDSKLAYNTSKSIDRLFEHSSLFRIKLVNNFLLGKKYRRTIPNAAYQLHFTAQFIFHPQTYLHVPEIGKSYASILPMAYLAVPTVSTVIRYVTIDISELGYAILLPKTEYKWEHLVTYMYFYRDSTCTAKDEFNITLRNHYAAEDIEQRTFRVILVNQIQMSSMPIAITSFQLSHSISFNETIQCKTNIDYQLIATQHKVKHYPSNIWCSYRVSYISM